MQAVILAGGRGERLRPMTDKLPKAMAHVKGRPFITLLLELLKRGGVEEVVLCTGYLGQLLKDYLGNGERWDIEIVYSQEEEPLGTAGALKMAEPLLKEWFFVVNGDTYLPIRHREVAQHFLATGYEAMMVVYDKDPETGARDVLVENGLVVKNSKHNPEPDFNYVNAGLLAMRKKALGFTAGLHLMSLEYGLYPFLIKRRLMAAYITEERFYDIGTPERLATFGRFIAK